MKTIYHYLFKYFLCLILSSPFVTKIIHMSNHLILSNDKSWILCFILFTLDPIPHYFVLVWIISICLYSVHRLFLLPCLVCQSIKWILQSSHLFLIYSILICFFFNKFFLAVENFDLFTVLSIFPLGIIFSP